MSPALVLVLGVAGGLGSVVRFVLDDAVGSRASSELNVGTIAVNISGSFLLGIVTGFILIAALPAPWTLVAGTGFLGGYTTFSTASTETVRLLQAGRVSAALLSGAGTALAALLTAGLGLTIGLLLAQL
ncbi:CrcB family protein [Arthrobacter echini]|uniref:Fluoride-specific ion channel FluC n=1 Tax=Arthrobacter echini TaxID=1529066 RepID=A0A4S5E4Y5_9MICC|nr:CrcB family protein [Arthrobacter echini]THJ66551.1 CrcB family protein [Arthrobacter echini]